MPMATLLTWALTSSLILRWVSGTLLTAGVTTVLLGISQATKQSRYPVQSLAQVQLLFLQHCQLLTEELINGYYY